MLKNPMQPTKNPKPKQKHSKTTNIEIDTYTTHIKHFVYLN